jgi:hypothetical protein
MTIVAREGTGAAMRTRQRGLGFVGVLLVLVAIVLAAIAGMKVVPAYIEYYTIKKAISGMTQSGELRNASVTEVRKAFDRRAAIDEISSISSRDLEIGKEGNEVVIGFAYEKKINLFKNVSLLIEFTGSSGGSTKAAD